MRLNLLIVLTNIFLSCVCNDKLTAQENEQRSNAIRFPNRIFTAVEQKISSIEQKMQKQTEKYLTRFQHQENKLRKKLWQRDSALARQLFDGTQEQYYKLENFSVKITQQAFYSGHLDSLSAALDFLRNDNLSNIASNAELEKALEHIKSFRGKLNQADEIKKYLLERKTILKEQFEKLGMVMELKKFQKQTYYYREQMNEYRNMFEDPSELEAKLIELVLKIPQFKNFFSNNSMLTALFPNMRPVNTSLSAVVMGLQPRALMNQYLSVRFGGTTNYDQALQQNVQSAQGQVDELRNKLSTLTNAHYGNAGDFETPHFKPNNQKTKIFFQRIEYGTNLQTQTGSFYFPITTDVGLSIGYRLNDKNLVGFGMSYKLGWGKDIRHINLNSQGAGFRSFADVNIKGSFFLSGGFEYNYQKPFNSLQQIYFLNDWQQSGLIGMTKIVSIKTRFFKKTKIQLLWDFLSYQQYPQTQALKFRIGYSF